MSNHTILGGSSVTAAQWRKAVFSMPQIPAFFSKKSREDI